MTIRQWLLSFAVSVTLVVLLMPVVLAWAEGDGNSAWVKIGSGEKQRNLSVGEVLGDAEIVDGKCSMPNMSMGIGRGLSLLRVGVDNETCRIVVKALVAQESAEGATFSQGLAESSTFSQGLVESSLPMNNIQRWRVEALTKVVGLNSIDDLTKTRTSLEFTRTPTSVFGGGNTATSCWGNHLPAPPFYYYVDDCWVNAFDFDGPTSAFIKLRGDYTHSLVPAFGHWATAKAEGTPTTDRALCEVGSLPAGPSDLECELDYGPVD